eukprot:NODE_856_length_1809_cov_18.653983_g801_i0.p1 GENE.NODE_856_length_1809_cov_18.653983_g801_i0~~NODE_856_length_1809_cov_18.653983_g801_i0.p1  ORF type:complete len:459 (-),score=101.31 NODE_856_length_1809_cov_18.653983_g801_i0:376-1752(-)
MPLKKMSDVKLANRQRKQAEQLQKKGSVYTRGDQKWLFKSQNQELVRLMRRRELTVRDAPTEAARAEILQPDQAGHLSGSAAHPTHTITQAQLRDHLDLRTLANQWQYENPSLGPYSLAYASNGRLLAMAGRKGHLGIVNIQTKEVVGETQLRQSIRDVTFCHDDRWVVVAQRDYAYMYTHQCAEAHRLKEHEQPLFLEFLPHHFLIASAGKTNKMVWQDISTGAVPGKKWLGPVRASAMCQNPNNAVILTGDMKGRISMWSPCAAGALATINAHQGPVSGVAVDLTGQYLVTCSLDQLLKVWDIRMFSELSKHQCPLSPSAVKISQSNIVAVSYGQKVELWDGVLMKKPKTLPYMTHRAPDMVHNLAFCPYEDVLGVGHAAGVQSVVVPGTGEPNFDSHAPNPLETKSQRTNRPIKMLLEKIRPEMIVMDPSKIVHTRPTLTFHERTAIVDRQRAHE